MSRRDCAACGNQRELQGIHGPVPCHYCSEPATPHPDPKGAMKAAIRAISPDPDHCIRCEKSFLPNDRAVEVYSDDVFVGWAHEPCEIEAHPGWHRKAVNVPYESFIDSRVKKKGVACG